MRLGEAARYIGIHPITLRTWTDNGLIPCTRIGTNPLGGQRKYQKQDLDQYLGRDTTPPTPPRLEAHYIRVSGGTGQETSLENQRLELAATATAPITRVYSDKSSGLNQNRPGLTRLLKDANTHTYTTVRVHREDRLARFGVEWIRQLLAKDNISLEILHTDKTGDARDELIRDFTSLIAVFAGRVYGIRSAENRRRLLQETESDV